MMPHRSSKFASGELRSSALHYGATRSRRPDCEDDGAETDPGCLWKRFEVIRKKPDVKVALTLVDEGCGVADHLLPGLKRFTRSPLVTVRAARWVNSMSNHCGSEIPSCGIDGTVTWKGYTIEFQINHEGRGAVVRGDDSDAFAILSEGSCGG